MSEPDSPERDRWAAAHTRPLKLHLRIIDVGRTTYRVASLRPASRIRFSTNFFHDTWHIVSSPAGAFLLGRLLWGLALLAAGVPVYLWMARRRRTAAA